MTSERQIRVAFITGGTRGIGAAIAQKLAAQGTSIAMTYLSRSSEANRFAGELSDVVGVEALAIRADVSDPVALLAAVDATIAHFGRLDILVNNAGLSIVGPWRTTRPTPSTACLR